MHSTAPGRSGPGSGGSKLHRTWIPTVLTAVVLAAAYAAALPNHVQAGDAGEFSTVLLTGGMPHPSGYPWMRMLAALARPAWYLGLPPAAAAALPCAIAGALGWVLFQRTVASWGAPWVAAWVACLAGLSSTVLLHVPDAEVWGPLLFWTALFVHAAVGPRRRSPFILGLLLGLATSHHLSAVLLAPLAVGAAWPGDAGVRKLLRAGADGV
jgi:hypothetical protein